MKKTRLQDFMKKYPNALIRNGHPDVCCYQLGYCEYFECAMHNGCTDCWNELLKDDKKWKKEWMKQWMPKNF